MRNCLLYRYLFSFILVYLSLLIGFYLSCSNSDSEDAPLASEEKPYCEHHTKSVNLDDITSLSYSAQEAIDALWGKWHCDLKWYDLDSVGVLYPDEKPSNVTISLLYEGGDIIDNSSKKIGGEDYDLLCGNRLEISSTLKIESSDGFFSESFPITAFVSRKKYYVKINVDTFSSKFVGSYNFVPNRDLEELPLSGTGVNFTCEYLDPSRVFAHGDIVEWFSTEDYIKEKEEEDYKLVEGHGAVFTTVEFECNSLEE